MPRLTPLLILPLGLLLAPVRGADPRYEDPDLTPADKAHWAFRAPVRPVPPTGSFTFRVRTPVDAFILAKLEAAGIPPTPVADRLTLVRRVTLDLTGLPPTPAEVASFLGDDTPDAYTRLVDRLLASPRYGERWATHWLDVVRFAESNGYEADGERPHAWRYRDYVVRSLNADKPYDVFVTEQLAGDELAARKDAREAADLWVATGMHRCGPVHMVGGNLDADVLRQEVLTEMVNGVGAAFLGLTLACARCHDHKFDPVSLGDYYRIQAFFGGTRYTDVDLATADEKAARKSKADALEKEAAPLKKQVADLDAPVRTKVAAQKRAALEPRYKDALDTPAEKRTAEQKKLAADAGTLVRVSWDEVLAAMPPAERAKRAALREQIHALAARAPEPAAAAWAIKTTDADAKTHVLKRGSPKTKLDIASPAYLRVMATPDAPKTRADLARWMTRPDHPLTARVIVNRLWQHHFGRGLVATPNDFGLKGARPTHPELLDWLATELVANRWSLKHLHRLMVLSSTYQQCQAAPHPADPDNKLLGRMPRRRLEAEAVRDSVLAAAGTMNPQVGGPSVKVPLEPEVYDLIFTEGEPDGLWPVTPDATQHTRRSLYLFNKRNVRLPVFEAFDQPDTLNSCAVRPVSTFAPQALILMNGPFVQEQGKALAVRLAGEADPLEALYRRMLGRAPKVAERAAAELFLRDQASSVRDRLRARLPVGLDVALPAGADPAHVRALADLCVVLFNTNEFVHIP
ncbi:DUF1549 and DUF1553 domain-containing protein [Urbifossiella limnaea]|uniref:DUF1553 domain-containing protein n=1 Tax=Urbifossiella limnaea TaxID=2528023 RepID=A0A517XTT5_9BACT|nr:DUF1549 and DUF1553 domain-containing protein [Urbifossiella limnaea]QDU20930.1 hypothetical protein ETAA1_28930 [Urbifossiella limnaea]